MYILGLSQLIYRIKNKFCVKTIYVCAYKFKFIKTHMHVIIHVFMLRKHLHAFYYIF